MSSLMTAVCLGLFLVGSASLDPQSRIIGGSDGEFMPFAVKILSQNQWFQTFGGGSFVTRRHILTQARLIHGYIFFYASYASNSLNDTFNDYLPEQYAHPDYNPDTFEHDIGIFVAQQSNRNPLIDVIALPAPFANVPMYNEQGIVYAFGYNSTSDFHQPQNIQASYQRVVFHPRCLDMLQERAELVTASHFCAMDEINHSSLCEGDMGAGFIMEIDGVKTVVGVGSIVTNMCHHTFPTIFTRVSDYVDWIKELTGIE